MPFIYYRIDVKTITMKAFKVLKVGKLVALFCIAATLFLGCKKNKSDTSPEQPNEEEVGIIQGRIVFPSSVSIDPNSLAVLSPIESSQVSNGEFSVKGYPNTFNTTMVTYPDGGVALMGYNAPGEKESVVSVQSTALALAMINPVALSLSTEGKSQLVRDFLNSPKLADLQHVITNNLHAQRDLFDTTNEDLQIKLGELFESAAFKTTDNTPVGSPITFNNSGRIFTFYNGENIFSTAVGIYKDGQRIWNSTLKGEPVFPTSILEFKEGKGSSLSGASLYSISYTLPDVGDYYFQIRTGLPLTNHGSLEYQEASKQNAINLTLTMLNMFLPFVKKGYTALECIQELTIMMYTYIQNVDISSNTSSIAYTFYTAVADLDETCLGGNFNNKYFRLLGKAFGYFDRVSALIGGSMNLGFYARQWSIAPAKFNTHYKVNAIDVENVDSSGEETLQIGTSYQGGIIFYIFNGFEAGYVDGEVHGRIVAPTDQGSAKWGCIGTLVGGTHSERGYGAANTEAIVAGCSQVGIAARLCADLELGGYSDWYLPSDDELYDLIVASGLNALFTVDGTKLSGLYWSSTEDTDTLAVIGLTDITSWINTNKDNTLNVRAIRTF